MMLAVILKSKETKPEPGLVVLWWDGAARWLVGGGGIMGVGPLGGVGRGVGLWVVGPRGCTIGGWCLASRYRCLRLLLRLPAILPIVEPCTKTTVPLHVMWVLLLLLLLWPLQLNLVLP